MSPPETSCILSWILVRREDDRSLALISEQHGRHQFLQEVSHSFTAWSTWCASATGQAWAVKFSFLPVVLEAEEAGNLDYLIFLCPAPHHPALFPRKYQLLTEHHPQSETSTFLQGFRAAWTQTTGGQDKSWWWLEHLDLVSKIWVMAWTVIRGRTFIFQGILLNFSLTQPGPMEVSALALLAQNGVGFSVSQGSVSRDGWDGFPMFQDGFL